jgi:heme exporter protein A
MLTLNNVSNHNINISLTISSAGLFILKGDDLDKQFILRSVAGIDRKSINNILWNNQEISKFYYLYSSDINFISQKLSLDQELTIKQNLNFLSSLTETKILIDSAVLYFELNDILHKKIKQLTEEERQRVKLSQLIFSPKTVWLLEDPDRFLSQKWQEKLFNLIATRAKEGGMVIISSDNQIFHKIGQIIKLNDFTTSSKNI